MEISGFDWDAGNWPKCEKHGVSKSEIEHALRQRPLILPDRANLDEARFNAIGRNAQGRYLFVVFTLRQKGAVTLMRPISARYMHAKEIEHYETRYGA